jgi:hypothetical protein
MIRGKYGAVIGLKEPIVWKLILGAPFDLDPSTQTLNQPWTLHPKFQALNPKLSTPHHDSYNLAPTCQTLNPKPRNPGSYTLNPIPWTLNPKPYTLDPTP